MNRSSLGRSYDILASKPWIVRIAGARSFGVATRRWLTRRTHLLWGTKSFEFWTVLMAALALVRPRSILELGSGRSTSYLAEYALKQGVPLASIEQSRAYWRHVRRGLANSFLDPRYVHYVPLDESRWYDVARLEAVVPRPCECLFIDGPVGVQEELGPGRRDSPHARRWLEEIMRSCRLVVFDDVHRRSNLKLLRELLDGLNLHSLYLSYVPHADAENVVALAVPPGAHASLLELCARLEFEVHTGHGVDRCTEP